MITEVLFRFKKHLHSTPNAHLVMLPGGREVWLPKKLCRKFITNSKMGGNVQIPAFLYERIMGKPAPAEDATTIIEHFIPEPIQPVNTTPDAELTR